MTPTLANHLFHRTMVHIRCLVTVFVLCVPHTHVPGGEVCGKKNLKKRNKGPGSAIRFEIMNKDTKVLNRKVQCRPVPPP